MPETSSDSDELKDALLQTNPDIIIYIEESLNDITMQTISSTPAFKVHLTEQKLQAHIDGVDLIRIRGGTIPHINFILDDLFPVRLTNSRFTLLKELVSEYEPFLLLFNGNPSTEYRRYIIQHLGGSVLKSPTSILDLIKIEFTLSSLYSPLKATLNHTRSHTSFFSSFLHVQTLSIFLDDTQSLDVSTTYWNVRSLGRSNTLYLPRKKFLIELQSSMDIILKAMPLIQAVHVYTITSIEKAQKIQQDIEATLKGLGIEISVLVSYGRPNYDYLPRRSSTNQPLSITRPINPDRSVRFTPPPPEGHSFSNAVFGYDIEVRLLSGLKPFLPQTELSSILLSNELERIRRAAENAENIGWHWLREALVRVDQNGVTGLSTVNKESRFYQHDAEAIITEHIKLSNIKIIPNKHTRYAQGIIRKFENIDKAMLLLNSNSLAILEALFSRRAEQKGLLSAVIVSYIQKKGLTNKEAKEIVHKQLPSLISAGLIRRGYAIECENCELNDWYPLSAVGSLIPCSGCGESLSLPVGGIPFSYTANELVKRFVDSGGLAVFMAAKTLRKIDYKSLIHFGGDLRKQNENITFAEVDILWLTEDFLGIIECKDYKSINKAALLAIRESLQQLFDNVIDDISARVIILYIRTEDVDLDKNLFQIVSMMAKKGRAKGIGIHLVINEQFYLGGSISSTPNDEINISALIPKKRHITKRRNVGTELQTITFGGLRDALDDDMIKTWLDALTDDLP